MLCVVEYMRVRDVANEHSQVSNRAFDIPQACIDEAVYRKDLTEIGRGGYHDLSRRVSN